MGSWRKTAPYVRDVSMVGFHNNTKEKSDGTVRFAHRAPMGTAAPPAGSVYQIVYMGKEIWIYEWYSYITPIIRKRPGNCALCRPCPHGGVRGACAQCNSCPHGKVGFHNNTEDFISLIIKVRGNCSLCRVKKATKHHCTHNIPKVGVFTKT